MLKQPYSIAVTKYEISATIVQRYASIVYSFGFENYNHAGSKELRFELTINPQAFISGFVANIDGDIFKGKTKEKHEAKQQYDAAVSKNENAILISQPYDDIPNVFQISSNIDSKSIILLDITIEQFITKKFNYNELNIQILKNFNDMCGNFGDVLFKLNINDKRGIYDVKIPSNSDKIQVNEEIMDNTNTNCSIQGIISGSDPINEMVIKYKIHGEQADSVILYDNKSQTFCHIISDVITNHVRTEQDNNGIQVQENILIPRRVVFVIDRSGSMDGTRWRSAISATIVTLKQLRVGFDRYCVMLFDDKIETVSGQLTITIADDDNIKAVIAFLESKNSRGGTDINLAVLEAIKMIKNDIMSLNQSNDDDYNFYMNQIVLITDGNVSNKKEIIRNVSSANNLNNIDKYNNKISIFAFGVGNDINTGNWVHNCGHAFLKLLALNNNGIYLRVKESYAQILFNEYYNILSQPILSKINIKYDNLRIKHLTCTSFNTLYIGNDIIVCGKIDNNKDLSINATVSGVTGKEIKLNNKLITKPIVLRTNFTVNIAGINDDDNDNQYIDKIWAYLKLKQMAQQRVLNENNDIYNNNNDMFEVSPLQLALKYKFITPWTSMIVVKQKDIKTTQLQLQNNNNNNNQPLSQANNHKSDNIRMNHMHRRDSSVPVPQLGFEDPDVLLHFEQLKVKDLENELFRKCNDIDVLNVNINKLRAQNIKLTTDLLETIQSKAALVSNCSQELHRLTMVLNTLTKIPQFQNTVNALINQSCRVVYNNNNNWNWIKWSYMDIVKWIISLKKCKYAKYKITLTINMKNENINGEYLPKLTKNDLKRLAINDVADCADIWIEIQVLIAL